MQNFQIFDEPNELRIKQECDYEGLRKITLSKIEGNAVTNNTFKIISSNCDEKNTKSEILFIVSSSHLTKKEIDFNWKSFDTLIIEYHKDFEVFTQKTITDKANPKIVIEYKITPEVNPKKQDDKQKEFAEKDDTKEEIVYKEYMSETLKPIRENYQKINSITEWTKIDKIKLWETTEGGTATYYFNKDNLKKIEVVSFGETGKKISQYYTMEKELSFVIEKTFNYEKPIITDTINAVENAEIVEEESFFKNGELIRQINNQDCGSPFAKDYLLEEQNRVINEFNKLNNKLNKE